MSTPPPSQQQQQQTSPRDNNNNENPRSSDQQQQHYNSQPGDPLPEDRFSIDYAIALWEQIQNCNVKKDPSLTSWLTESLRNAAELALWGDKNNHDVADFLIMESTMVSHLTDIVDTPNLPSAVYVQCIQSVVLLLQNHKRESTLFFILSNGKFNRIIEAKLDYGDEDIVSIFVSFLKTVTQRLQSKNILPLFCNAGSFPLLAAAMNSTLLTHDDRMVRTSVRQVIAQLLRIEDDAVKEFARGCLPRLVDDLGAFLEAQLRNLALYVTDESTSLTFVEMTDEDLLDEGLYFIDLLTGCSSEEERLRMGRLMKESVLERLLPHTQDAESSDLVAATVILMFMAKWFRNAPKWFVILCLMSKNTNDSDDDDDDDDTVFEFKEDANDSPMIRALAWALLVPSASTAHHPASTVTRSAICCIGSLFHQLTPKGEVEGCCSTNNNKKKHHHHHHHEDEKEHHHPNESPHVMRKLVRRLGHLVDEALLGFSRKIDRTSAYNFSVITHIATIIHQHRDAKNTSDKNDQHDDDSSSNSNNIINTFFKWVCMDSELFASEQSALRLEVLLMLQNKSENVKESPHYFSPTTLNVFARDQWNSFIEDLRFPLKRLLKFRSPVSQQERLTHRASVITAFLNNSNVFGKKYFEEKLQVELGKLATKTLAGSSSSDTTTPENSSTENDSRSYVSGTLVNGEVSSDGGFPSVFLEIEGNILKVKKYEFGQLYNSIWSKEHQNEIIVEANNKNTNSSSSKQSKSSTIPSSQVITKEEPVEIQKIPIVALQLTPDVSRQFVLHFCTPQCCNLAPFSVSFPSRTVAAKTLGVLDEASKILRERTRKKFEKLLSLKNSKKEK